MSKFQGVLKMFMLGMLKTILKTVLKYKKNTITLYGMCWNWAADFIFLIRFYTHNWSETYISYVSLRLRVQNRRTKWNFPLNFRTMRKLSELYSRIFQTQSSGCVSGLDHFRNFTNLKILNIKIVKYLLNCKRYLSYKFRIVQKSSECWVLENLDVHLERTTSELELKSEKSKIGTFCLELNGQVLVRQD